MTIDPKITLTQQADRAAEVTTELLQRAKAVVATQGIQEPHVRVALLAAVLQSISITYASMEAERLAIQAP